MRIALVVRRFDCGGVETYLLRLGSQLLRRGHHVEVIATEGRGEWFELIRREGMTSQVLDVRGSLTVALHSRKVAGVLRHGNFDAVFLNHARLAQASLAQLPDAVIAIPVLHNDHENIYHVGCGNERAWNVAVSVGPRVTAEARRRLNARQIVEIAHGVEVPEADFARVDASERPLRVLFVGRLVHEQKGVLLIPTILDAVRRQGLDVRLTVIGDGSDAPGLAEQCRLRGLGAHVRFLGAVDPTVVAGEMRSAHLLLLPSHYEGFGITLIEAMAAGCVPVASRLIGVTDRSVVNGESGFLEAVGDAGAFSARVAQLHRSPELLRKMSLLAAERARNEFSLQRMADAYEELLQRARAGMFGLARSRRQLPLLDSILVGRRDRLPSGWPGQLRYRWERLRGREP